MKSLIDLLSKMLADASIWCSACTIRDLKTITNRVRDEGLSFLTISLPSFGKDFDRSLDQGKIDSTQFLGFRRQKSGSLPNLFSGLTSLVFDRNGVLLEEPSLDAIFFIRTLSRTFGKIELPCSDRRTEDAYKSYLRCEEEIKFGDRDDDGNHLLDDFYRLSDLLWGNVLQNINSAIGTGCYLVPKHGPGTTAEGVKANRKYSHRTWPSRLATHFEPADYIIPSWDYHDELEAVDFLEPGAEIPVKVITVPKTLKTPRIIGVEPVAMQYCQQSILEVLVPCLESSKILKSSIGFTDQKPNQRLALLSSKNQRFATIDLSDASDRVHKNDVYNMLRSVPLLRDHIFACRSHSSKLPDGTIVPLEKFASMGSALCFPIEAMMFLSITLVGILRSKGLRISLRNIDKILTQGVRIYGDDIIIPTEYALIVSDALKSFRMKVNTSKSFWTGKFRESCGVDAYDGTDVTPVYVRHSLPEKRTDTLNLVSAVSLMNHLYEKGMWQSAQHLRKRLGKLINLPHVTERSPLLGFESKLVEYQYERIHPTLHHPLTKGWCLKETIPINRIDGWQALMKFFLKRGIPPLNAKELIRSGRPVAFTLNHRWSLPY